MRTTTSRLLLGTTLSAIAATLLMGCNKAPEAAPDSRAPPNSMGSQTDSGVTPNAAPSTMGAKVDDATVTGRVKTALMAEPGIKSLDISVVTLQGEVQLSGFVNDQGQIDQITQIARATEGAGSVKNELKVKQ